MGTNLIFSSGGKGDCRHVYYFHSFFQEEKETVDMCTNISVFLQEDKETVDICTNVIDFLQEEKETVDMFTNVRVFLQEKDCRHV